jgi:hypothetical protein
VQSLRFLLGSVLALSLVPSLAFGEESLVQWAQRRVDEGIVKQLAEKNARRSKFSRAEPIPVQRRARVTQAATSVDKRGREFLTFAIDIRFGDKWRENDVVGCVYRPTGDLFVKVGDEYRPAAYLLGRNVAPVAGVCEAAPPRS